MSDFKPKSKMLSLRISEEQYEALKNISAARGLRSISELARVAMERVGSVPLCAEEEARYLELDGRVRRLERDVDRLLSRGVVNGN